MIRNQKDVRELYFVSVEAADVLEEHGYHTVGAIRRAELWQLEEVSPDSLLNEMNEIKNQLGGLPEYEEASEGRSDCPVIKKNQIETDIGVLRLEEEKLGGNKSMFNFYVENGDSSRRIFSFIDEKDGYGISPPDGFSWGEEIFRLVDDSGYELAPPNISRDN